MDPLTPSLKEAVVKSHVSFWRLIAQELGDRCHTSTDRDFKTVSVRFEREGDSFLTITLPAFGKDFERSLDLGQCDPSLFTGFARRGKLPIFLGGFMDLVFDRVSGSLLDTPDIDAIQAVRQLTLLFGKVLKPCSDAKVEAAMDRYVQCEKEVSEWDDHIRGELLEEFTLMSHLLFVDVFSDLDRKVYRGEIHPRHGPGATADRLTGNGKFDQAEWTTRMESIFPFGDYALPNWRFNYQLERVNFLEPGAERPVRVISVPKTQKTPRIIAIEPTCMQYMQQGLMAEFVNSLESDHVGDNNRPNVVQGMIGFSDQEPNQLLACKGSSDGSLATLDLSDASDRVSNLLVSCMFRERFPFLNWGVQATRSLKADVPGHGVLSLSKFASMGSALCFPIEAMVFLTCVMVGIQRSTGRRLTREDVSLLKGRVRVYGDDIVCPVEHVAAVMEALELFGAKVNHAKSFWTGRFRESCGREYYGGDDVSIVRVRRDFPDNRYDVPGVVSLVELRNQLYMAGLWRTAAQVDEAVVEVLPHYPTVKPTSPALGRHSVCTYEIHMYDLYGTHAPLVMGYAVKSMSPRSPISGEGALLKCLSKKGLLPFEDPRHLERQGRPDAVYLKRRYLSPF